MWNEEIVKDVEFSKKQPLKIVSQNPQDLQGQKSKVYLQRLLDRDEEEFGAVRNKSGGLASLKMR